ncbi:MAG: anaerobic ribonucleoside-triphosphate reductase activating protein [Oscillospiraceae bacterium]|nr:anaerobic ribonucleoside-triphosphate reductase activating protein [Oscillospiraceae bacterium]MBR3849813.1 anaerobic ribonucleoside-triphosphate reductase activating protein [Oscillospiraceae bacterium]
MNIHGLQKMTLLDFPGRVACTVFFGGCDFRCPFCHNWELLDGSCPPLMDDAELLRFLEKRKGLLDGVCFTGGEPLLQKELPRLAEEIKALGYPIKLDTNGNHPDALRAMLERGLVDYVAMDIKNAPGRYAETVGLPELDLAPIRRSVELLMEGTVDYEFRTTVIDQLHDADSFAEIGAWIRGAKRYFLQPFKDRDTVPFGGLSAPNAEKLRLYRQTVLPFVQAAEIRGADD